MNCIDCKHWDTRGNESWARKPHVGEYPHEFPCPKLHKTLHVEISTEGMDCAAYANFIDTPSNFGCIFFEELND